ncbi:DMT family transporter [Micromonospora sp. ALFpr18c]|uniref:DMT family transporter n=1 Tax=Micromonospora sp. ALFpr18c TaxID=1458665 RepID=UPI00124BA7F8|nr:DMT family transporter [Micromonospora sp. ALFpr18c]KAB1934752.1 DMT family transporter [Micromonospora sp. ALFpr18c]
MTRRSWIELVILSALWGAVYPLITVALRDFSPTLVVLGRVLLAALLLLPFAVRRDALRLIWRNPRAIIETVLVQSTAPLLLLTYGQQYVSASVAGILVGAQPLFVALLALRYAPDERPQGWKGLTGIVLGLVGVVMLFGVDLRGGRMALIGGTLILIAAVCYAAGAMLIHRRYAETPSLGVATSAMLVTTAAVVVPASATIPTRLPGAEATGALLVLGIVCTGATLALFYALITRVGPARAALAFYLSPAFAVAFGVAFLREQISVFAILGLAAIVVGSVLAAHRREPTPP